MFIVGYRPDGGAVSRAELLHARRLATEVQPAVVEAGPFAAAVWQGPRQARPLLGRHRDLIGIGDVRLDDRAAVARLAGLERDGELPDLELALAAIDRHGERAIRELIGDFAFLVWDPRAHKLIAARDAFGVRTLYHRTASGLLWFADRMEPLQPSGGWDPEYFADYLTGANAPGDHTPWLDVRGVTPGGFMLLRGSVRSHRRYWSAGEFEAVERDAGAVERFRAMLEEAVLSRVTPGQTWAQLSGGLDSSSIVAIAQASAGGLAGTITSVDTLGRGDERRFSDAVLRRWRVRNEQVTDCWAWQDDGCAPPATDGPGVLYPFFARERRMHAMLRGGGARVLLSGIGSDHYLAGSLDYIADQAAAGRWRAVVSDLAAWSVAHRTSFWKLAGQQVIAPLAPWLRRRHEPGPSWIEPAFARRHATADRLSAARIAAAPRGRRFAGPIADGLTAIHAWLQRWPYGDEIEIRYPFLHRPLVEASLRLAPELRIRPAGGTKWVLRQAMRGVLPEEVRTRNGKGTIDDRILWSFTRERTRLDALLRDPILAQIGCVDAAALRDAVQRARSGVRVPLGSLMNALSLETWLAVREGCWTRTQAAPTAA